MVVGPAAPPAELTFPKALGAGPNKGMTSSRTIAGVLKPLLPATLRPLALAAPKPNATTPAAKAITAPASKATALAAPRPPAVAPKPTVAAEPTKPKSKYTLQLSAFPTREEAESFAKRYDGTFVLPTELPGKGTWFRVRCGAFTSYQEASAAKAAFEKQNKAIALIATH
jgi:septal ring-binding cell division protein DamX